MRLHVGEVRHPETIRCRCYELSVHEVTRTVLVFVADRGQLELAGASSARQAFFFHQSWHRAVGDLDALATQLLPDLLRAVDTVAVGLVHAQNLGLESLVTDASCAGRARLGGVVGGGSKLQGSADWLCADPAGSRKELLET